MTALTVRDRTVFDATGNPLVLFGVLDRELGEIVETFDNRQAARDAAAELESQYDGEFISIRLPVEYD